MTAPQPPAGDARAERTPAGTASRERGLGGTSTSAGPGPLAGWRVLVPRPAAGVSPAAVALAAAGADAVVVPLVETVPPEDPTPVDDALLALGAGWYGWLVVTSQAAVPVLELRAARAGRTLAAIVGDAGVRVAAVGPGTARALREAGVTPSLVPSGESTARALVATWPALPSTADGGTGPAQRVLFPRGDLAAPTLADGLRARGWQVDDVVAYRTVPAAPPLAEVRAAWADGSIGAALLTSASTVRELVAQLGAPPAGTALVAIGPTTAAEVERLGLPLAGVAQEQTMTSLVAALASAVGGSTTAPAANAHPPATDDVTRSSATPDGESATPTEAAAPTPPTPRSEEHA
ncbi:uroporphyrinogen-III synthase [Cellulomonas sp. H30R-01]|uniref:uroporphyrinogen-III synthase n=1 Tax=Cellulomonas sp. H30R-01 TaxID=2704467 RepID=UPI00138BC005|nr:uroporphyrinogen-III synthase [Cellulomonas sp. H30R-01]QHT57704.1 uroporphyrinogen-III synthase [Cellulomonas sp. H30R-01]